MCCLLAATTRGCEQERATTAWWWWYNSELTASLCWTSQSQRRDAKNPAPKTHHVAFVVGQREDVQTLWVTSRLAFTRIEESRRPREDGDKGVDTTKLFLIYEALAVCVDSQNSVKQLSHAIWEYHAEPERQPLIYFNSPLSSLYNLCSFFSVSLSFQKIEWNHDQDSPDDCQSEYSTRDANISSKEREKSPQITTLLRAAPTSGESLWL